MQAAFPIEAASQDYDSLKELASIARLITYARQSAKTLNAAFPVWCLDLALGAVLQEMYGAAVPAAAAPDNNEQPQPAELN